MPAPDSLLDLYTRELNDLWSASGQMLRALKRLAPKCSDPALRTMLHASAATITTQNSVLEEMIIASGAKVRKEHCKGMQGLVAEAVKHAIDEAPARGPVLDAVIIAQFQRMTHYAIAGFGTAASYAGTLGRKADKAKLDRATKAFCRSDEYMTKLAEMAVNIEAEAS